MTTTNLLAFTLSILFFISKVNSQTITPPLLKSCISEDNIEAKIACTEDQFKKLLKEELDKSEYFQESKRNLSFKLKLLISERGIINFANVESLNPKDAELINAIKNHFINAISNISYKVLMQSATQNDQSMTHMLSYEITFNNYGPKSTHEIKHGKKKDYGPDVFKVVEDMPRFPGCEDWNYDQKEIKQCSEKLMLQYIYDRVGRTKDDNDEFYEGMYVVKFIVNTDGSLSDFEFTYKNTPCSNCESIILETLKGMPTWIPGKQKEKKVRVLYTLPVKFKRSLNRITKNR